MSEEKKFKCENCGEAEFDTEQQLRGHQMTCRPKDKEDLPDRSAKRVPFGTPERRFNPPEDDGFVYRVFNDNWRHKPGRIERARKAGYELVNHGRSGESVGTNEDGSEINGVLMRIPKEFYDEDQGLKQRQVDRVDEQIHRGKFDKKLTQTYGGVKSEIRQTR